MNGNWWCWRGYKTYDEGEQLIGENILKGINFSESTINKQQILLFKENVRMIKTLSGESSNSL